MITVMFRSSSFSSWDYCQAKYFLVYVLGLQEKSNKKAEKGTISHKVLEVLAIVKKLFQETDKEYVTYIDEHIGFVEANKDEFYAITKLSDKDVKKINTSRKNKEIYKIPCQLSLGHERVGSTFVNNIIEKCYNHYSKKSIHTFDHLDYRDCWNWVWMALELNNGIYDPRFRNIQDPERPFVFELDEPWAEYKFFYNNEWLTGKLALKGTIDLVTKIDDDTLEIIDWKTGQKKNWATGQSKDLDDFYKDTQLMMYYYAARKVYQDFKNIYLTINYIRDGGPHTVCYDDDTILLVKERIKERFEEIKKAENFTLLDPTFQDFRCKRLCSFYLDREDGKPLCQRIQQEVYELGINHVSESRKNPNFTLGSYQSPGE